MFFFCISQGVLLKKSPKRLCLNRIAKTIKFITSTLIKCIVLVYFSKYFISSELLKVYGTLKKT